MAMTTHRPNGRVGLGHSPLEDECLLATMVGAMGGIFLIRARHGHWQPTILRWECCPWARQLYLLLRNGL